MTTADQFFFATVCTGEKLLLCAAYTAATLTFSFRFFFFGRMVLLHYGKDYRDHRKNFFFASQHWHRHRHYVFPTEILILWAEMSRHTLVIWVGGQMLRAVFFLTYMFGPFFLAIAEPFLPQCGQLADPPTNICSVIPAQTKHTHFLPLLCLPPQFALNFPFP